MKRLFTVAAISDIHIDKYSLKKSYFDSLIDNADIFLIGGDMNNGKKEEVRSFLELISNINIPIVVIFGNHDCDARDLREIKNELAQNKLIKVLDGGYVEFRLGGKRVGVAGVKGYGGGFFPYKFLGRGEASTKAFVEEENREVEKLNKALIRMKDSLPDFKIILTHFAPFKETIEGESKELYIALGSSKLGDVIKEINPHISLSGHAHHGSRGIKKASGKISTCNISYRVNKEKILLFDFFQNGNIKLRYL